MALFKNALLALLASIAFFWVTATEERQKIYIRGLNCNCSDKFIKPGYKCYAKSYNRSFSTFNLIGATKMPVYNLSVSSCDIFYLFWLFPVHSIVGLFEYLRYLSLRRLSLGCSIDTETFTEKFCTRHSSMTFAVCWNSWTPATLCYDWW